MQDLQDLYLEQLQDAWSAENQLLEALPKMIENAGDSSLRSAFEQHLQKTEGHVDRLQNIFEAMGEKAGGKKCKGMEGLIKEGEELLKEKGDGNVKDAGLIGAAQKVEHYEVALYGTLRTWARQLGREDDEALLQQTLNEEEEADRLLTDIAESHVNVRAEH